MKICLMSVNNIRHLPDIIFFELFIRKRKDMLEKIKDIIVKLVEKHGYDKVLHFIFGGEICACLTMLLFALFRLFLPIYGAMLVGYILSLVCVYGLAYFKEAKIDSEFSWDDLNYSVMGCMPVGIVVGITILLFLI